MKRVIALWLAVLMLAVLLTGCAGGQEPAPTTAPEETVAPTPDPTPDRSLSWAKAFHDDSLPAGSLTPEEIAFCVTDEYGNSSVVNVSKAEIQSWWDEQETLPRTHYFEQFMPEALQELFPLLDYAMANSYSCFCVPTTGFTPSDVAVGKSFLQWMYRINSSIVSAESRGSFDLGGGKTLQYIQITFRGMDEQGSRSEYQESIAKAREIVAQIPEGSGDYEKILFLYNWLTENVYYDDNDYYESEWNLLYDTLVRNQTVCAGYAEALYVMSNLAGVECYVTMGTLFDGENWEGHAWNVAKIDGEYYQFDATWDQGSPPERYCFFGVSDETLQSFWARLVMLPPEQYSQPCTHDLPLPGGDPIPAGLSAGTVEESSYSQPFADLYLSWNAAWHAYSREEITEMFYDGLELDMGQYLRLGTPYLDLMLERNGELLQVLMELSPVESGDGKRGNSASRYMDAVEQEIEAQGESGIETRRFRTEINGRAYECLAVSGVLDGNAGAEIVYCTERDGCLVTIYVVSYAEARCEQILQELLREAPEV